MAADISKQTCRTCGGEIPAGAPEGLCPVCLVAMNLATQTHCDVPLGTNPAPPPPPGLDEIAPLFPQLHITACLGRGGMGVVYQARQKSLDRLVALKLLAPERGKDPAFAERFQREARALARLNHPNIVTIHDFGTAGPYYFLLMEFVDGVNLRQLLQSRKLSPEEALAIVPRLCEALQYAHERGIVHRDIKPENLLLDREGRVKIADFGIAKLVADPVEANPLVGPADGVKEGPAPPSLPAAGTPGYMAPEQRTAPQTVDNRADIYSLGVVFYEMLTGERPTASVEPPSHRVQIDVRLDRIVLRALEKSPELRWQTAADLRTELETLAGAPPPMLPTPTPSPARHWSRGVLVGLLIATFILSLTAGVATKGPFTYRAKAVLSGTFNPELVASTEVLERATLELGLAQRWGELSQPEIVQRLRKSLYLASSQGATWEMRVSGAQSRDVEEIAGKIAAIVCELDAGTKVVSSPVGSAYLVAPNYAAIFLTGSILALGLGGLSAASYAFRSRRRSMDMPQAPLHATTAPALALVLVLSSFLIPLSGMIVVESVLRVQYARELRDQAQRQAGDMRDAALARRRSTDLFRQLDEAGRKLQNHLVAGTVTSREATQIQAEIEQLKADRGAADQELAEANEQLKLSSVRFHSRPVIGPGFYFLPALLFAFPGTLMGWRHLGAIRGLRAPRPHQTTALIASLVWPALLAGTTVGLLVLLPLNYGPWSTLGLILSCLAFLGVNAWMISRTLRWVRGREAVALRKVPWERLGAAAALLAVGLAGVSWLGRGPRVPRPVQYDAPVAPAVTPAQPSQSRPPAKPGSSLTDSVDLRVLQAQYEKTLMELLEGQKELQLLPTKTDLDQATREAQAMAMQQRIRVLTDQQESLRRRIESLHTAVQEQ